MSPETKRLMVRNKILAKLNSAEIEMPGGNAAVATYLSHELGVTVHTIVADALTEVADAIEAEAQAARAAATSGRSFHPQGTHQDGECVGKHYGLTRAAHIVRNLANP